MSGAMRTTLQTVPESIPADHVTGLRAKLRASTGTKVSPYFHIYIGFLLPVNLKCRDILKKKCMFTFTKLIKKFN